MCALFQDVILEFAFEYLVFWQDCIFMGMGIY